MKRITVAIGTATDDDLSWLMKQNHWDQTATVNRAIRALRFLQEREGDIRVVEPNGDLAILKFL